MRSHAGSSTHKSRDALIIARAMCRIEMAVSDGNDSTGTKRNASYSSWVLCKQSQMVRDLRCVADSLLSPNLKGSNRRIRIEAACVRIRSVSSGQSDQIKFQIKGYVRLPFKLAGRCSMKVLNSFWMEATAIE